MKLVHKIQSKENQNASTSQNELKYKYQKNASLEERGTSQKVHMLKTSRQSYPIINH